MLDKKVETLLLGFSTDTSGEIILLVGEQKKGQPVPVKLLHGPRVNELYKELTDRELKLQMAKEAK